MKKLILLLALLFAMSSVAQAQIARGATAAATGSSTGFTLTISYNCQYTGNGFMVVGVGTNTDDLSTVVWNGSEGATLIDKSTAGAAQFWVRVAPTTGTHDVVISNPGFHNMRGVVMCYSGVNQSTTADSISASTDTNSGTSFSMSTTTVADNAWTFFVVHGGLTSEASIAGTGSVLVGQLLDGTYGSISLFDSNAALTPAGSKSMQVTNGSSNTYYASLASYAPAGGGGGGTTPRGMLLGVGP